MCEEWVVSHASTLLYLLSEMLKFSLKKASFFLIEKKICEGKLKIFLEY
jgi:hypothetical protein